MTNVPAYLRTDAEGADAPVIEECEVITHLGNGYFNVITRDIPTPFPVYGDRLSSRVTFVEYARAQGRL